MRQMMDPTKWIKEPWEERLLEFDPTNSIASGDSIASISGVTIWEGDTEKTSTMIGGTPYLSEGMVYALIKGGEDGHDYWIRIRLITTNGDKIEDDLRLLVKQRGA